MKEYDEAQKCPTGLNELRGYTNTYNVRKIILLPLPLNCTD